MDFKKLNEQLEKFVVNEISDKLKQSYLAKRQAQLDKAQAAMEKARASVKNSDQRQIQALPTGIDKETAEEIFDELKREMRRISNGEDWRMEEQDNRLCLEVRYWGVWEGDDGSGDYDWQTLAPKYRDKLDSILTKIDKKYGVQIHEPVSEKNWLCFELDITKAKKDSRLSYENEKVWNEFLKKNNGEDVTGPRQKNRNIFIATFDFYGTGYVTRTAELRIDPNGENFDAKYCADGNLKLGKRQLATNASFVDCVKACQDFIDSRAARKNDPKRRKTDAELQAEYEQALKKGNNSWVWDCVDVYVANRMNYRSTCNYNSFVPRFNLRTRWIGMDGEARQCLQIELRHSTVYYGVYELIDSNEEFGFTAGLPIKQETYQLKSERQALQIKKWLPIVAEKLRDLGRDIR